MSIVKISSWTEICISRQVYFKYLVIYWNYQVTSHVNRNEMILYETLVTSKWN